MRRRTCASAIGLGASLGLGLMSMPAQAALVAAGSPAGPVVKSAISAANQSLARTYWTAERLRAARPGDSLLSGKSLADVTTSQWSGGGDLNYDAGFAVVSPVGGTTLTDKVGGQGIAFSQSRGLTMYSFGYPAAAPYDGTDIAWCHGQVADGPLGQSQDQGMLCDMTGGSSGGPWFLNYDEGTGIGTLNSLNSFTYNLPLLSDKMYGPYFGNVIQAAYNSAQSL